MTSVFKKVEKQIESSSEERIKSGLLLIDRTNLLTTEEKNKLRSLCEVRRQVLWFDGLKDKEPVPTPYVHWNTKEKIPVYFRKKLEVCIKNKCVYGCNKND